MLSRPNNGAVGHVECIALRRELNEVIPAVGDNRVGIAPAHHLFHLVRAFAEARVDTQTRTLAVECLQLCHAMALVGDHVVERVEVLRFKRRFLLNQAFLQAEGMQDAGTQQVCYPGPEHFWFEVGHRLVTQQLFEPQHRVSDSVGIDLVIAARDGGLDFGNTGFVDVRCICKRLVQPLE